MNETGAGGNGPGVYRPEIDGLRAVSILAVVLYHAGVPGFQAGYLGVDVFFVISGFLITGQLLREVEITGGIDLKRFYARRVRRIVPAFVTMAVGTSVLAILFLLPLNEQRLFGNALSRAAVFYYNVAVWRGGYDYGAVDAQEQPLMHTWSLSVEEQFYLVWPFMCLVATRIGRPLASFMAVVLVSLLGTWWVFPHDADAAFFLLPFRAWELGLGACAAARPWRTPPRAAAVGALSGASLALLILLSGAIRPPDLPAQVVGSGNCVVRRPRVCSESRVIALAHRSDGWPWADVLRVVPVALAAAGDCPAGHLPGRSRV